MKKLLVLMCCSALLSGCMAANIAASIADASYSIANTLKENGYDVTTAESKFEYFDVEQQTTTPPLRKYFKLVDTDNEYIVFAASESTDTKDCFVGIKFDKSNVETDIKKLQQFITWSNQTETQSQPQSIELTSNNSKKIAVSLVVDEIQKSPLLIYSGKNCDFFSKTKSYAINPSNVEKMIEEITNWHNAL